MAELLDRITKREAEQILSEQALAIQALTTAFYALHDTLVARGVFQAGDVADTLGRFQCDDLAFGSYVAGILKNLREMPFRPQTVRDTLRVVDGGGDGGK